MRLGYIYNELQLLTCLKHGLWSTNKKYKYFRGEGLIALVTAETYNGVVAIARIYGEPVELKKNLWKEHNYNFLYNIEFLHIVPLKERENINDSELNDIFDVKKGYHLNQEKIEDMYDQKALKPKWIEKFVMKQLETVPNVLDFYIENLDSLIQEAEIRPEMHWNMNVDLTEEEDRTSLEFPLKDFDLNNYKTSICVTDINEINDDNERLNLKKSKADIADTEGDSPLLQPTGRKREFNNYGDILESDLEPLAEITEKDFDIENIKNKKLQENTHPKRKENSNIHTNSKPKGVKRDYIKEAITKGKIGLAGEILVLEHEKQTLLDAGCNELARRVKHISVEHGDGLGYDILSYTIEGEEKFIEVKTTSNANDTSFFIEDAEVKFSKENSEKYYLYRVYNLKSEKPSFYVVKGDVSKRFNLTAKTYIVDLTYIN